MSSDCHIALHHHWKKLCPITNPMALVAHVKCRFTFAMADEFVAKIRATAQLFIRWKRACINMNVLLMKRSCVTSMAFNGLRYVTSDPSLEHFTSWLSRTTPSSSRN